MHPSSYNEMQRLVATYLSRDKQLRILDVGSYDVNGSYRPLFDVPGWIYEGADATAGPNVQHVLANSYEWQLPHIYDVVISGQTLEHVEFFWLAWREMVKALKPGGMIFLILPSAGPEHQYPVDCWRFYRDGMTALGKLEDLEVVEAKTLAVDPWRDTVGVFRKPGGHMPESPLSVRSPLRLHLGCGNKKLDGWVNIDSAKTDATNLVRDLSRGLPYQDSSVDEILCDNVLEHIGPAADLIFILNEFYRVLRPGSIATIIVPDGRTQTAWQDPTHLRAFVPRSALYWNQDLEWAKLYGITANFDVQTEEYANGHGEAFLKFICVARPKAP